MPENDQPEALMPRTRDFKAGIGFMFGQPPKIFRAIKAAPVDKFAIALDRTNEKKSERDQKISRGLTVNQESKSTQRGGGSISTVFSIISMHFIAALGQR